MPVAVEMHNVGHQNLQREVIALVEHALSGRSGDWRVLILGSLEGERWEMKIYGPNAFERSYTLEKAAGEHTPERIAALVRRMVP